MISAACADRLRNWKFDQAVRYLDEGATENETGTLKALAATFGDSAHFEGSLGDVVRAAVQRLLDGYPDE